MAMTSWTTTAALNVLATTGIDFNEGCAPSVLNDSMREVMAVLKTAIDTGNITATGVTAALFNTTATTINAFGAATTLNIGAATGTLTVANTTLAAKAGTFSTTLGVTGHTTFEGVTSTGATGTGKLVYDTSPTIATPIINSAAHVGGSWVADATWTLPAVTLGGAVTVPTGVTVTGAGTAAITGFATVSAATGMAVGGATAGTGGVAFPATAVAVANVNTLDDYDEYAPGASACTGAVTVSVGWKLTKVGNKVTLTLPSTFGAGVATTNWHYGTVLPAKYRPSADTYFLVRVVDNGAALTAPGLLIVSASTGVIAVYKEQSQAVNFTVTATAGMDPTAVGWTI